MKGNYDWFKKPKKEKSISPFELNNEGKSTALVLRYAGCNLRCPLCYAWRYAWFMGNTDTTEKYEIQTVLKRLDNLPSYVENSKYQNQKDISIGWIRIQGGEPCLTLRRCINTIEFAKKAISVIHENGMNRYENTRAIIQTNGILFSNLDINDQYKFKRHLEEALNSIDGKGRIIFEVSFKSPHSKGYFGKIFNSQIKGFKILLENISSLWNADFTNVATYPVAGLGPSIDFHNQEIVPIDDYMLKRYHREVPLFHKSTWSREFRELIESFTQEIVPTYEAYREFRNNPNTNNGTKIAIEELEASKFQTAWISGYAGRYQEFGIKTLPKVSDILRKLSQEPKEWLGLVKRYKSWKQVLDRIPLAQTPDQLLVMVKEMNEYFYPSHPSGHYLYL